MWQVFLMYALFGSIFSVGKVALEASQPFFLTGMRMLLAGAVLTCYVALRSSNSLKVPRHCWGTLFLVALFNVFITNAFEFWGLQYMTSGKTCLLYSLSPFAAAIIAYFFGTETMTAKKWSGLAIGLVSFVPLMIAPWTAEDSQTSLELAAEGALAISAVTAVIGWLLVKKLTVSQHCTPMSVNGYSFLLAGIMSLITSVTVETWDPLPVSRYSEFAWTLLYIVIIHNIICYSIYASSLNRFSVTFMAFAGLSNPVFAGFFGLVFLGEPITPSFALALSGIAVGLYLYYAAETEVTISGGECGSG